MFYSHEILTSRQYGVATIWLVATVGNGSSTKKVTRKAIQEVDVQKACGKIIEPGAPVALRLQGHLLYGVSRVYNQQCSYMLADLQKIQTHMHVFYTKFGENQLDPAAGQARLENLIVMNDPDFVPDMQLPKFDLDALVVSSQVTNKTSSQMSPFDDTLLSGSGSLGPDFNIYLDLHEEDSIGPQESPLGLRGLSSSQKPEGDRLIINQDDEFAGAGDWGMEIDEEGNVMELEEPAVVQDDFDLLPLPTVEGENQERADSQQHGQRNVDAEGDIIMEELQQKVQSDAEAVPQQQAREEHSAFLSDGHRREAPSKRGRKARVLAADEETQLSKTAMREWQEDYLKNCCTKKVKPVGAAQARVNAMLLTFGLGLANIGQNIGVPGMLHPLALNFSGDSLFTVFTGLKVSGPSRGTRRSASESIEDDEQNERRVRPRLGSDAGQQGRGFEGDDDVFGQDAPLMNSSPEVGREAQAPMSDHISSALHLPWNRGSSAVLGSSVRGSARKGHIPSSPLGNRGNAQDFVRFSDGVSIGGDDLGLGGLNSQGDSFDGIRLGEEERVQEHAGDEQKQSEWPALDIEGRNFLSFMDTTIRENGERRHDEDFDKNRRWVAFGDVFVPRDTPRATAAQAFYHTLCLATKGKLEVQQNSDPYGPFGEIWIGAKLAAAAAAAPAE